ncbi:MAG TPA: HD domain-containing phosphohydrolase [Bryobacteraceae bacterium]|nr:HD domain-containing phosphohydrolase [Bryobacteraceae bacterium]
MDQKPFTTIYVATHIVLGGLVLVIAGANWECHDWPRFLAFLLTAMVAAVLKVSLPGVNLTASVSALFFIIGIVVLSLPEAVAMGALSTLVQTTCLRNTRPKPIQICFSICCTVNAIYVSWLAFRWSNTHGFEPLALAVLAMAYFVANTLPVASIVALTEHRGVFETWRGSQWVLPYYGVGSSMAWLVSRVPESIQWELPIICLPVVYLVHRSNRAHLKQMEVEKSHVEAMNSLHLRTIEALALAIDAKDHTTHDHLQRVQLYALQIGKDLALSAEDMEALRAASVLHDIGKLAVPEDIINKPGKLNRAEFEKMKVHPVVGAEILERVSFPYPVVPIVRAHHERWDGSGYPYGLKGEEIPIGARILAAVDCLDALASDRQYRRALPLDQAMAKVMSESGASFDPRVVRALLARYVELEQRASEMKPKLQPVLSTDLKITRGSAPAAGFEREDVETLLTERALASFAEQVGSTVRFDALTYHACLDRVMRRVYATGDVELLPNCPEVPLGEGLTGWVAAARRPILNGNPGVEPTTQPVAAQSALAMPAAGGVLTLYRIEQDAFSPKELAALIPFADAMGRAALATSAA